jgi:membrane protease YdiL (CAAX protease family)
LPVSEATRPPATAPARDASFVLERQPRLSVILSLPCTGCGHWYAQNPQRGARFLGASLALLGTSAAFASFDDPQASEVGALLFRGWQNLKFYAAFDAYREARALRAARPGEIRTSEESLADLARAPFRSDTLRSPWVWAGVPASLALGFTATRLFPGLFAEESTAGALGASTRASEVLLTGRALPVAIGEEAFFRGVVQGALEERLGARRGWLAGSAIFGASHLLNFVSRDEETRRLSIDPVAVVALPVITTAGALMGKAYQDTGHQLATSVAVHFWYDFTLFALDLLSPEEGAPAMLRLGSSF